MSSKEGTTSPNKSLRFLIVDDHIGSRSLVKAVLSQEGYTNIRACENGLEALSVLKQRTSISLCAIGICPP